jgi:uncharacterized repeat protein (TIGR01451 family)
VTKSVTSERGSTYLLNGPYGPVEVVIVAPGDQVDFTVTVKNTGSDAGFFYVNDYWRSSRWNFVDWISAPPPSWDHYEGAGCGDVCENLDMEVFLAPGESATYQYRAEKQALGMALNTAYYNYADTYFYDPSIADYTYVTFAYAGGFVYPFGSLLFDDMTDLSSKDGPDTVAPNSAMSYDINVHNPSSFEAPLYVEDFLPVGVEFESLASATGCTTSQSGFEPLTNKFWWSGTVSTDGCDLNLLTQTDADLVDGQVLVNEASLSDKLQGAPFGFLTKETTVDEGVDLVLNKSVDKLVGMWGDFLTYEITLQNNGEPAHNAYVDDTLPADVEMWPNTLTADSGTVTFDAVTNTIHWVGDLDAGQSVVITYKVRIISGTATGKIMLNVATAGAENWNSTAYSSALTEELVNLWYLPAVMNGMTPTP